MADFHKSLNAARKNASGVVSLREMGWSREAGSFLATGMKQLDELLGGGGLPVGRMSEFYGTASTGKTGLISRIMAGVTFRGGCVAYVDVFNSLSPEFLQAAGVDLDNVLWIRGSAAAFPGGGDGPDDSTLVNDSDSRESEDRFLRRALKQAEILVKSGNFPLVVLDVAELVSPGAEGGSGFRSRMTLLPGGVWFRLQRAAEKSKSVLLLLSGRRLTSGASARVFSLQGLQGVWGGNKAPADGEPSFFRNSENREKHALLLGLKGSLSVMKGGRSGRSILFHCHL